MAPMAVGPGGLPWENIPTQEQFEREVLANEIQYSHAQQRFITEPGRWPARVFSFRIFENCTGKRSNLPVS